MCPALKLGLIEKEEEEEKMNKYDGKNVEVVITMGGRDAGDET